MRAHRVVTLLSCLGTGVLIAAALPPWGWWPLAFAGLVCLDRLIADRPRWARFRRGAAVGLGLYVPSLAWMIDMTAPGYAIAAVAYAALFGLAITIVPATAPGRWVALPGAIALTELLRWSWPFGGVPLSSLAVGQVASPLAPVLRLGGALLLVEVAVVVGVGLAALISRRWLAAGVAAAVVVVAVVVAVVGPRASATGEELRVALVQGGGPQGTRAWNTDEREVFERHLEASELVEPPVDLVVWPEDVVDVEELASSEEDAELADLARDLDTTLIAGIVEDAGDDHFTNYSAAYDADGEIVDRYDKVHRVPFGEYVPLRWLLEPFGGGNLTVPRRAHRRAAGAAVDPRGRAERGHLVGDLLRRPRPRGRRGRRRARAQPDERLVVHRNAGADPAGGVVADAGDRERPVAATGGARPASRRSSGPTGPSSSGPRCPSRRCSTARSSCVRAPRRTPASATGRRWRWRWSAWRSVG